MHSLIRVINHPAQVFTERMHDRKWWEAFIPVILTFFAVSVFPQVNDAGNLWKMIKDLLVLLLLVLGTYPLSCLAFYLAGRVFKPSVRYSSILATWGYSYLPIFFFWALTVVSHLVLPPSTPIFAAGVLGFVLLSLMIALFLWKVLFYFVELRVVLGLNLWQMLVASMIIGALFIGYYVCVGTVFGLKIPIV